MLSYCAVTTPIRFDDIKVGVEFVSPGRTVTETDIVLFAGLSGDYNVLHTDAEHMKSSQFGERIAHGLLGLSIQQGLAARVVAGCSWSCPSRGSAGSSAVPSRSATPSTWSRASPTSGERTGRAGAS